MSASLLTAAEAERHIGQLERVQLEDVLTMKWFKNHKILEELNAQATLHVLSLEDEFVRAFCITYEKVDVLVYNAIAMEFWRRRIFPEIMKGKLTEMVNFPLYTSIYQELILCGLIDLMTYHSDGCQAAEATLPDLVDYCFRNVTDLIQNAPSGIDFHKGKTKNPGDRMKELLQINEEESLNIQMEKIRYSIGIKSISILCSIAGHLNDLPLGVRHRLLSVHDSVLLLLQLMDIAPWKYEKDEQIFEFDGQKWIKIEDEEEFRVLKIEGQVWIGIFNLLTDRENMNKYEINDYRKSQILKLRSRLNDILLDQIPILTHFWRYLEQLAMFNPLIAKRDLIMEQSAFIYDGFRMKYKGKWTKIAEEKKQMLSSLNQQQLMEMGKILSDLYASDVWQA